MNLAYELNNFELDGIITPTPFKEERWLADFSDISAKQGKCSFEQCGASDIFDVLVAFANNS
tara:strand:- start:3307 stop:3492 length:186 start_codon:yes stop_codon:yes gene_type:complete